MVQRTPVLHTEHRILGSSSGGRVLESFVLPKWSSEQEEVHGRHVSMHASLAAASCTPAGKSLPLCHRPPDTSCRRRADPALAESRSLHASGAAQRRHAVSFPCRGQLD